MIKKKKNVKLLIVIIEIEFLRLINDRDGVETCK